MDYIYGVVNERAKKNSYIGGNTETASVNVDNSEGTIYVNCNLTQSKVKELIQSSLQTLSYSDTEQDNYFVTSVNEQDGIINVTKKQINQTLPDVPQEDGTYVLKAQVNEGNVVYSWEAAL